MSLADILQSTNLLCKGYNEVQSVISKINDETIDHHEIDDYFSIIHYLATKFSTSPNILLLRLYHSIVKNEPFQLTENSSLNVFLQSLAQLLEVEIAKSSLADELLAFVYTIIDKDFNDIATVAKSDVELKQSPAVQNFIIKLTPIIKAKIKNTVKDSIDYSKRMAQEKSEKD